MSILSIGGGISQFSSLVVRLSLLGRDRRTEGSAISVQGMIQQHLLLTLPNKNHININHEKGSKEKSKRPSTQGGKNEGEANHHHD